MKKISKAISILLAFVMIFSLSATAIASDINTVNDDKAIELVPANMQLTRSKDGGIEATFDLLQQIGPEENEPETRIIDWKVVGVAKLRMCIYHGNGAGNFDWEINLTNGDLVKGCSATFVCEEDNLLIDWNYAKVYMDEYYGTGALYSKASGSEVFDFPHDVDYNKKIRFKWSSFYVTGVKDNYTVLSGNITGTVEDFCV